jgi:hypothetical protein
LGGYTTTGNYGKANSGYGIYNPNPVKNYYFINDYCGATLSDSSYDGNSPNTFYCQTVTFGQSGLPTDQYGMPI